MKELQSPLDLEAEVQALVAYLSLKWTPLGCLEAVIRTIRAAAEHDARAWLDDDRASTALCTLEDARLALLAANLGTDDEKSHGPSFDACCQLLDSLAYNCSAVARAGQELDGKWRYTSRIPVLHAKVVAQYPELRDCLPIGWEVLAAMPYPSDALEEYNSAPDRELFQGSRVEGVLSGDFVFRTAAPVVAALRKSQGFPPSECLVDAVYAHFLGCQQYLNTEKLIQAVADLQLPLTKPELVFEVETQTTNPHLQVLLQLRRPTFDKEEYLRTLQRAAEYESLSADEKRKREQAAELEEIARLEQIRDEGDAMEQAKAAKVLALLQQTFNR